MSKLTSYIGILAVTILAANFLGLTVNTGSGVLLGLLTNPTQLFDTNFYLNVTNALSLALGSVVVIGLFLQGKTDAAISLSLIGTLLLIGWDMLNIFNGLKDINIYFATLFMSPLILIYILTAVEWARAVN